MTRRLEQSWILNALGTSLALASLAITSEAIAREPVELDVTEIFFELNDTDGDLGLHSLIDGVPWKKLRIVGPNGGTLMNVQLNRGLARQGLTELFFESAEPNFDDLDPETFFARFPEGEYAVRGRTLLRQRLTGDTELTHVLPAPPDFSVNGGDADPDEGEECDEENLPEISSPVVVEFDAVTDSHPELGEEGDVEVIRYRVVAEFEDDDENVFVANIDVQPEDGVGSYAVEIPDDFLVDGVEVKFEVLAREESFNQTAVESCPFEYVDD